jgi:hypothetical protein
MRNVMSIVAALRSDAQRKVLCLRAPSKGP